MHGCVAPTGTAPVGHHGGRLRVVIREGAISYVWTREEGSAPNRIITRAKICPDAAPPPKTRKPNTPKPSPKIMNLDLDASSTIEGKACTLLPAPDHFIPQTPSLLPAALSRAPPPRTAPPLSQNPQNRNGSTLSHSPPSMKIARFIPSRRRPPSSSKRIPTPLGKTNSNINKTERTY